MNFKFKAPPGTILAHTVTLHSPHRLQGIELGGAAPAAEGKWEIRTPLRCPYGKLRATQGGYKSGFAAALLPSLVQVSGVALV